MDGQWETEVVVVVALGGGRGHRVDDGLLLPRGRCLGQQGGEEAAGLVGAAKLCSVGGGRQIGRAVVNAFRGLDACNPCNFLINACTTLYTAATYARLCPN